MNQIIENYKNAKSEVENAKKNLQNLQKKGNELQSSILKLESELETAEAQKTKLLHDFTSGKCGKVKVFEAEKTLEDLKLKGKVELQLQGEITRKIEELGKELPKLQEKKVNTAKEVYEIIGKRLNDKLARLIDEVNIAFQVNRNCRLTLDYVHFLPNVFPEQREKAAMGEKLQELFEKEIKG